MIINHPLSNGRSTTFESLRPCSLPPWLLIVAGLRPVGQLRGGSDEKNRLEMMDLIWFSGEFDHGKGDLMRIELLWFNGDDLSINTGCIHQNLGHIVGKWWLMDDFRGFNTNTLNYEKKYSCWDEIPPEPIVDACISYILKRLKMSPPPT